MACRSRGFLFVVALYLLALDSVSAQVFPSTGISFESYPGYTNTIAAGDFNGDGKQDLAIADVTDGIGTGRVRILLGDGHGGFTAAPGSPFGIGNNPWSIAVADFNHDGKLDIAVCNDGTANHQPDTIAIMLGDGTGRFAPAPGSPIALPANTGPLALAVADFNRDGIADLVSANLHNDTVSVFLGNGNGTFSLAPGSPVSVPVEPWSVAVADFNGDGKLDVAIGSYGGGVAVLIGDGAGRLTSVAGSPFAAGPMPFHVAAGDFNGDGKPDLAVGNWSIGGFPEYGNVTVLLNNGDGTFRSSGDGPFSVGVDVSSVYVADFNGDGKLDIAALGSDGGNATVLLGNGAGGFIPAPGGSSSVTDFATFMAVADIDGDGTLDLAVSSGTILLNLTKPPSLAVSASHTGNFTQGQNGTYTLTVSNQVGAGPTRGAVTVTETLPLGLFLVSMTGTGWNCNGGTCQQSNVLTNGTSYPPITVTVAATFGAPLQVVNSVTASSSGSVNATANDTTGINQLSQSITFGALPPRVYGATPFTLSATASSGLMVTFASTTTSVCTVSANTLTIVGAGMCSVLASQAGNAIYAAAAGVTQSFAVSKASLTVTAQAQTLTYGVTLNPIVTFSGFVNGDTVTVISGAPGFTTNASTTNGNPNAGSWTLTPSLGALSAANYTFAAFNTGILTVNKAPLTVTANYLTTAVGSQLPPLTYSMSGFVGGDSSAVVAGAPVLSVTAFVGSPAGRYPINIGLGTLTAANYSFVLVPGVLVLTNFPTAAVNVSGPTPAAAGSYLGQSFTLPDGLPWTSITFNFFSDQGLTPTAVGTAYLFSGPYSGTPSGLRSILSGGSQMALATFPKVLLPRDISSGFIAASTGTADGAYVFPSSLVLQANTKYYLYVDTSSGSFPGGIMTGGGSPGGFAASTSASNFVALSSSTNFRVNGTLVQPVSSIDLSASPNPSTLGQKVTITALVSSSNGTPGGTVQFSDGDTVLGSAPIASGHAVFTTSSLAVGSHLVLAWYSGSGGLPSAQASIVVNVNPLPTALTVVANPPSPIFGQPVSLTVTTAPPAGSPPPTGQIAFYLDGDSPFSRPLVGSTSFSSGAATFALNNLTVGAHSVLARYAGDAVWSAAALEIPLVVSPAPTRTAVSLGVVAGQLVATGSVSPVAPGSGIPVGTVQFVDTSNHAVLANSTLATGTAIATLGLDAAAHPIAAVYAGDNNFKSSMSSPLPIVTNAAQQYSTRFAPDEMLTLFGVAGLNGDTSGALPLPTTLAGVSVRIRDSAGADHAALLYGVFASAGQINFALPAGLPPGPAGLTLTLPGGDSLATAINIGTLAPGMFTADATGRGVYAGQVLYVRADGSETTSPSAAWDNTTHSYVASPVNMANGDRTFLVLYGTGLRHAYALTATAGGVNLPVAFWGPQGQYPGLDQLNLELPPSLAGAGLLSIVIMADDQAANPVTAMIR